MSFASGALALGLSVGWAFTDLSPDEPLPLGGYTARQGATLRPGGTPLRARVAAIRQGDHVLALVSAEMLTAPESLVREVRRRLPPNVSLFLWATHTHCAPDSQMLNDRMTLAVPGIATYRADRLQWTAGRIAAAVRRAAGRAAPTGDVGFQQGLAEASGPRRPLVHPRGEAWRVSVAGRTLLAGFDAHPTLYDESELRTRGDWPGLLSARVGGLAATGPIGGVAPRVPGASAPEKAWNLTDRVIGSWQDRPVQGDGAAWASEPVDLARPSAHPEFAPAYGVPPALAALAVGRFAPSSAELSGFRLGDLLVVGVPGEPSPEVGSRIQAEGRRAGFGHVVVLSHVNGWMGYILEPNDYDSGGYEATLAFHGREAADRVVEAAGRLAVTLGQSSTPPQTR